MILGPWACRSESESADELRRNGSASGFVGLEPALGVSRQNLRNKVSRWLGNQHWRRWQNVGNTPTTSSCIDIRPCHVTRGQAFILQQDTIQGCYRTTHPAQTPSPFEVDGRTAHCAGSVQLRMNPLRTFSVGIKPWPHLGSILEPENIKNINQGGHLGR
jgi:hypothetical protein